ncbi:MAG TPA: metallophosphoesterase [Polyangiaceae bacterium]
MRPRSLLVTGDLHLGPAAPAGTEQAIVSLLERRESSEWICLGDLFDLSADTSGSPPAASVVEHLDRYSELRRAIAQHLVDGGAVTLVVGNHDAELAAAGVRDAVLTRLDAPASANLKIEPWWIRRGPIHLEHGHVWDPDNAPIHPLVPTEHTKEPLGISLTRRVLAPTGAYQFAHAHQTTPLKGLLRAIRELHVHAPEVIVRYFVTGAKVFWQAANHEHESTRREGQRAIDAFAAMRGVDSATIERMIERRPMPRHGEAAATFARLYFDRALATVTAVAATTAAVVEHTPGYSVVAAAGLLYLMGSRGNRAHRYSASLQRRVQAAAQAILPMVEANVVVFGHTHVAESAPGYVNTGAFGFPSTKGRPYLLVGEDARITRGWLGNAIDLEVVSDANAS